MHVKVPRGDTRRFKACQIGRVNQELSNATRARKSDGRRHQLRSTVYGNLPSWPKNGVVFKYLEMFQFTHTYRYATLAPGGSIGAESTRLQVVALPRHESRESNQILPAFRSGHYSARSLLHPTLSGNAPNKSDVITTCAR